MLLLELQLLLLVIVANGAPLVGSRLCGHRFAWPLDGGLRLPDGHRLFGDHTTLRGLLLAILFATLTAWLLGLPAVDGTLIGLAAMAGDAISSLIKRRLGIAPGGRTPGLDQLPEALLPLALLAGNYALAWWSVILLAVAFMLFDMIASRLLYRFGLRDRPY